MSVFGRINRLGEPSSLPAVHRRPLVHPELDEPGTPITRAQVNEVIGTTLFDVALMRHWRSGTSSTLSI
jgi:hypothetical protein